MTGSRLRLLCWRRASGLLTPRFGSSLRPIQRVPIAPGSNLRKTLLANGFQAL